MNWHLQCVWQSSGESRKPHVVDRTPCLGAPHHFLEEKQAGNLGYRNHFSYVELLTAFPLYTIPRNKQSEWMMHAFGVPEDMVEHCREFDCYSSHVCQQACGQCLVSYKKQSVWLFQNVLKPHWLSSVWCTVSVIHWNGIFLLRKLYL